MGLATGMAVCLLLVLYIQSELGYDHYHENGNRIYRLAVQRIYPGRIASLGEIPQSIGQAVKREFPEVLESVRVSRDGKTVHIGDRVFKDEAIFRADTGFFRVFTGQFIAGNAQQVLQRPNTAILAESAATRFFGSANNAIGQHILLNGTNDCLIEGVCSDWPDKSHFRFTVLVSNAGASQETPNYYDLSTYTYLLLKTNASAANLEAKLPSIVSKYVAPTIQNGFGESFEQFTKDGNGYHYFLQPLQSIHLHSTLEDEINPTTSIEVIYIAAAIGLFILLLASINFVNLSTAISLERAREIGVRKTFGSDRKNIIGQFLCESTLFSVISIAVSFLLAALFLPLLRNITGTQLSIEYFFQPLRLMLILGFASLIGLMAGLYPALVLSSFQPVAVLKGRLKSNPRGIVLRNALLVFQFAVSVILIISTLVINHQMRLMLGNKLGFEKEHIIAIKGLYSLQSNRQAFLQALPTIQGVEDWSACSDLPGGEAYVSSAFQVVDTRIQRTDRTAHVDEQYAQVFGLQLVAGRFFSRTFPSDSTAIVLNEAAVKDFGFTDPLGKKLTSTEANYNDRDKKSPSVYTVIGVLKDYHFSSLHQKITPLVLSNANRFGGSMATVKIKAGLLPTALPALENAWKQWAPKEAFSYSFLDEIVSRQYNAELTSQKIITWFSVLAIIIACTGLFGLVSFTTFQRTREISIRKVLGASRTHVIYLLSKDFVKLVVLAALIAYPVAWWGMHQWLQQFAYRTAINGWDFFLALLIVSIIAFATISVQAVKAAFTKPAKSLTIE